MRYLDVVALLALVAATLAERKTGLVVHSPLLQSSSSRGAASKVAVLVSGSLRRYFLGSSLEHLVKPMVKEGHQVDYYLALSTGWHVPWHNAAYMQKLAWDPLFGPPSEEPPTSEHIRKVVREGLEQAGGRLVELDVREEMPLDDDQRLQELRNTVVTEVAAGRLPRLSARVQKARDVDGVYPTLPKGTGSTTEANRNLLKLYRSMEGLWTALENREAQQVGAYDYVLFLRDDAKWLQDFSLGGALNQAGPSSDVYVLSCDDPFTTPWHLNDHAHLFRRQHADLVGKYYSWMISGAPLQCKSGVDGQVCESEELLLHRLAQASAKVQKLGQSLMPFERSARVVTKTGEVKTCLHKFCQSHANPLAGMESESLCDDLQV